MKKLTKFLTLAFLAVSVPIEAQVPTVPEYGKLLVLENRELKPHFEGGLDLGLSLDNSIENVYLVNGLINYVVNPLWSFGLELSGNKTQKKDELKRLEDSGDIKISSVTPDFFSQVTARFHPIKGQLNFMNKYQSPFEFALVLGGGVTYNTRYQKSSSLVSWGGEFIVPIAGAYKGVAGIRHYKAYAFQKEELSFTSLLLGMRKEF